jgi:riboflavin synthase
MYTGIVEELGEVVAVERLPGAARIAIRGPLVTSDASPGDSLSINGVCLTVTGTQDGTFTADVMLETLNRSSLGALRPGARVNLERSMRLDGRLGGHLVQGHVDGTGTIISRSPAEHWDVVRIALPAGLSRYVVEKGSVSVDGVSLTVTATGEDPPWLEVSLIPETLRRTTLGTKQPGDTVNLEADVIAKYVERLLTGGARS